MFIVLLRHYDVKLQTVNNYCTLENEAYHMHISAVLEVLEVRIYSNKRRGAY